MLFVEITRRNLLVCALRNAPGLSWYTVVVSTRAMKAKNEFVVLALLVRNSSEKGSAGPASLSLIDSVHTT